VTGLVVRGVAAQRMVATAPNADFGMKASGLFTIHELPDAIRIVVVDDDAGGYGDNGEDPWEVSGGRGRAQSTSPEDEALFLLRQRREAALDDARAELEELHAYAGSMPAFVLPGGPVTLVASVLEASLSGGERAAPLVAIAFGSERVSERVAAFEACDIAVDEIDVELWEASADGAQLATRLLGAVTLGVGELLVGETDELNTVLPVLEPGGRVVGSVKILLEARHGQRAMV